MMKRVAGLAALAACLASPARADLIQFNPTGGATSIGGYNPGTLAVSSLDFGFGDALARGASTPGIGFVVGQTFTLYTQARLLSVNTPGGGVTPNGLNAVNGYQITEISAFQEVVTSASVSTSGTTYGFALAPGGTNVTKIFFQDLAAPGAVPADPVTGVGYNQGTLILQETTTAVGTANFTDTTRGGGALVVPLNRSGSGDYMTTNTDQGSGAESLTLAVQSQLNNWFVTPNLSGSAFTADLMLPFRDIAPSSAFNDPTLAPGSAPSILPLVGGINGFGGQDILLQTANATESFTGTVPEPSSLLLVGLGGVGALALLRRRATQA